MNWIRIAVGIMDDPTTHALAEALGVSVPATTGHMVGVLRCLPQHARDGDLSNVPDTTLERWAMWTGKRGRFAAAFRAQLCDAQGVVRSWEKHNGAALREGDRQREKAKRYRERAEAVPRDATRDVPGTVPQPSRPNVTTTITERDVTADSLSPLTTTTPDGPVVDHRDPEHRRRLVVVANQGITQQCGEQPVPILAQHAGTQAAAEALASAGVPLAFAERAIFTAASTTLPADGRPPRSLRYYAASTVAAWIAERTHRERAVTAPPEPLPSPEAAEFAALRERAGREILPGVALVVDRGAA